MGASAATLRVATSTCVPSYAYNILTKKNKNKLNMTKLKKYNSIDHFYSEDLSHPSVGLIPSLDGQVVYTEPVVRVVIKMTSHQSGYRKIFNFLSGTEICRIIVESYNYLEYNIVESVN